MSNAKKLANELSKDIELFVNVILYGLCDSIPYCEKCPIRGIVCGNREVMQEWLESEATEDGKR